MTLGQLLRILRARWCSTIVAFLLAFAAVLTWAVLTPKRYTAIASLMVDIKSPDPIAGMVLQGTTSPSYMITQVDVIQSLRVARRVVRSLKLDENATLRANWQEATHGAGNFEVWVGELLRGGLDARPSRGSNVINVSFTGADPAFAATVANAFVQNYLATTVDLRTDPAKQFGTFFDERAKQSREALELAQAKLAAFQRANGFIATDERLDVENARLSELSSQAVALEAAVAESTSRQSQAKSNSERMQEVLNNPVVSALTSDLTRSEAHLEELTSRLGENNPQVIELRSNIASLRAKLVTATQRASGSVGVTNSVNQTRLTELRSSIANQRAKMLRLKDLRSEAAVLQREVENAQRSYDGVLARVNQTSLESQSAPSNVSALEYATEPTQPSSISLTKSALIGLLAGGVLAIATALIRESRDRRLRSIDDLPLLINLPAIGVVPAFASARVGGILPRVRAALLPRRTGVRRLPNHGSV